MSSTWNSELPLVISRLIPPFGNHEPFTVKDDRHNFSGSLLKEVVNKTSKFFDSFISLRYRIISFLFDCDSEV